MSTTNMAHLGEHAANEIGLLHVGRPGVVQLVVGVNHEPSNPISEKQETH